ncbi:MAG: DUF378 domain-containing protein [Dehalococcoidia bacterium]
MEIVQVIAIVLAAIGAINWGLVALFRVDLVAAVTGAGDFGRMNTATRIVYVLVAIAGIIALTAIIPLLDTDTNVI